jgi:hypothetical protein
MRGKKIIMKSALQHLLSPCQCERQDKEKRKRISIPSLSALEGRDLHEDVIWVRGGGGARWDVFPHVRTVFPVVSYSNDDEITYQTFGLRSPSYNPPESTLP